VTTSRKSPAKASIVKKHTSEKRAVAKPRSGHESPSPIVPIERRASHERRLKEDRRKQEVPVAVERRVMERRVKVSRRRQIDPTTCERDYSPDEIEFMAAMDQYKRFSGRMFPTCSEVLEVLRNLGYEKRPKEEPAPAPIADVADAAMAVPHQPALID
jgi:hypothetical protein